MKKMVLDRDSKKRKTEGLEKQDKKRKEELIVRESAGGRSERRKERMNEGGKGRK